MAASQNSQDLFLRVEAVRRESEGVLSLTLVSPDRAVLPPWTPGAHLDLCLPSGLVRHYSLCGDPADRFSYQVAVLREKDGRGGSVEVHSTQLVGCTLRVLGPRNHFKLVEAPAYLFVAGGIGITPILPMIAKIASRGRPWRLVYGGRSRDSMAFLRLLSSYNRSNVVVAPQDEVGMLPVAAELDATPREAAIYCCGPPGLLQAVQTECERRGLNGALHVERFKSESDSAAQAPNDDRVTFEVRLARSDITLTVPPDRTLLSVVRGAVPDILSDCEEGFCGTCETAVLGGIPEHHDTILSEAERDAGDTMMICVGRCKSRLLVLDL